jgi:hypothetical protein
MKNEIKGLIIKYFMQENLKNYKYINFFDNNELGMALANSLSLNVCKLNKQGQEIIDKMYEFICQEYSVNSKENFNSIDEFKNQIKPLTFSKVDNLCTDVINHWQVFEGKFIEEILTEIDFKTVLGVQLALAYFNNHCEVSENGIKFINNSKKNLIEYIEKNKNKRDDSHV